MAAPQPKRVSTREIERAVESAIPFLSEKADSPVPTVPIEQGPTFLSTTSTPSPPPSPKEMSQSALPNPLRSNPVSPRDNSYPPTTMPLSPPSSATYPNSNMYATAGAAKQYHPTLTPLPLSPPILKPSTKPPLSLNAPNPTTRTNFSPTTPTYNFPAGYPIQGYTHAITTDAKRLVSHSASHSASAAMNIASASGASQTSTLKQRSPSQPHLPSYFAGATAQQAPAIPLRMSSIPANNKPRKLSLQNQRSLCTLRAKNTTDDRENTITSAQQAGSTTPRRVSPPLRTNKALPSPPLNRAEELRTREKVQATSPTTRDSPPRATDDMSKRAGQVWPDEEITHPGIAELPATTATPHTSTHARASSVSATLNQPFYQPEIEALTSSVTKSSPSPVDIDVSDIQPTAPLKDSPRSKLKASPSPTYANFPTPPNHSVPTFAQVQPQASNSPAHPPRSTSLNPKPKPTKAKQNTNAPIESLPKKGKHKVTEQGGWAAGIGEGGGRPVQQSRTQRDKERKKRSKAKVLVEHVDIIRDEFWEKRPWILSGKI
jgi:hypothetical protein